MVHRFNWTRSWRYYRHSKYVSVIPTFIGYYFLDSSYKNIYFIIFNLLASPNISNSMIFDISIELKLTLAIFGCAGRETWVVTLHCLRAQERDSLNLRPCHNSWNLLGVSPSLLHDDQTTTRLIHGLLSRSVALGRTMSGTSDKVCCKKSAYRRPLVIIIKYTLLRSYF